MVVTDFLAAHVFQYSFYLLSTNTKQSAAAVSHAAGPEMLDAGPDDDELMLNVLRCHETY